MGTSISIHNLRRHHAMATGTHLQSLLPSYLEAFSSIYNLRATVPWWLEHTCGCCYPVCLEAFFICNLGMHHVMVTGTHLSWFETCSWFRFYIEDYSCALWDPLYIFLYILTLPCQNWMPGIWKWQEFKMAATALHFISDDFRGLWFFKHSLHVDRGWPSARKS